MLFPLYSPRRFPAPWEKLSTLKETDMVRTMSQKTMLSTMRTSGLIVFLLVASFAMAQTEFSAEMFDSQKGSNGKVYFSKDKVRFESANKDPRSGGVVIINLATQTTTVLMNQQHMYMELTPQWPASARPTTSSAPATWRLLAQTGCSCRKTRAEVAARSAARQ